MENVRQGNKVKQKVVRHFGYTINDEEIEALKKLALKYKLELIKQQKGLLLIPKGTLLEQIQSAAHNENDRDLPVNLRIYRHQEYVCMGMHMVYGELFKQLGFHRVLKHWSRSKASVRMLLHMVMARIASPQSKRASVHLLEREYSVKLDVNVVYRMMDKLDEAAIDKIQQQSYGYVKDILGEALNVIFMTVRPCILRP
ncbi:MAG: hypothetical protein NZM35_09460 [Chitinophagales bacterium]|nr:hypothetical protein [Chitinophagales bacterium]MDW8419446.1 hypothetical protein [Chitinophagales bacterium]